MKYQVMVLSQDQIFARMLELEFRYLHMKAGVGAAMEPNDRAEVLILDLDSATAPPSDRYRKMIGISRRPAMLTEQASSCSMIFHRPFRMSSLRREVLAEMGTPMVDWEQEPAGSRVIRLEETTRTLHCNRQTIALTGQEFRILQCLLANRGEPVSRARLTEVIGRSEANKTDVYVCYLRRKTDQLPGGRLIETVRGKGYRIP